MARLIGNVDATGSLSTSVSAPATNASAVSLYLPFDSTVNDASANGHSVTASGNAAISNSQAKFGSYSLLLDGTGDYLTISDDASLEFGSSDLTIEAFFYENDNTGHMIVQKRAANGGWSSGTWLLAVNAAVESDADDAGKIQFWAWDYNSTANLLQFDNGAALSSGWHHLCVTRSGDTWRLFLDGRQVDTDTWSGSIGNASHPITIGRDTYAGRDRYYANCFIDDLRITKGIALYTQNFVLPSQAVGASLSGTNETNSGSNLTSLYLPLNSDVNDDSSNNHTITGLGGAVISSAQSRFGGSSIYLDGGVNNANGSRLRVSSDVYDQFYLSDFTMEMFIYPTTLKAARLWSQWESTRPLLLQIQSDGDLQVLTNNTSRLVTSGGVTANSWFHIALVRIGETFTLYIDGVNKGRFEMTGNLNSYSNDAYIGARYSGAAGFEGYIDDFRIVRSGIYTDDFTPPTSALTASISQTRNDLAVLYLPFDDLQDKARNHLVTANGNAAVSATQAKFGGKSLYLDGNGDYLTIPHSGDFEFSDDVFTIEFWMRPSATDGNRLIYNKRANVSTYGSVYIAIVSGNIVAGATSNGSAWNLISVNTPFGSVSTNTWYHVALVREADKTFKGYLDGVATTLSTNTAAIAANTTNVHIGGDTNAYKYYGYIDDLMVSRFAKTFSAAPSVATGGEVIDVATDTRTFSSVWNLNSAEVTEAFKAGTWPS